MGRLVRLWEAPTRNVLSLGGGTTRSYLLGGGPGAGSREAGRKGRECRGAVASTTSYGAFTLIFDVISFQNRIFSIIFHDVIGYYRVIITL